MNVTSILPAAAPAVAALGAAEGTGLMAVALPLLLPGLCWALAGGATVLAGYQLGRYFTLRAMKEATKAGDAPAT